MRGRVVRWLSHVILLICVPVVGWTANFSFTGGFGQDDFEQYFTFQIGVSSTVTITSLSYAGGTNSAGATILGGGFDPVLTLFTGALDPLGLLINNNNDGGCGLVAQDSVTNACWDSYLQTLLTPGSYTLVLTQSDNTANGPTLADGFFRAGQGNFTGPLFLGSPGMFVDANPSQRDGHWAVDILDVNTAASIPEPGSLLLMLGGAAAIVMRWIFQRN